MTQEDKILLLKDLCARLPYKVKGIITYDKSNTTFTVEGIDNNVLHLSDAEECYVEDFKPYLRPMSSIAELITAKEWSSLGGIDLIDWYNANHIDYRGLIEKGLALEAPENMYKIYKYDR